MSQLSFHFITSAIVPLYSWRHRSRIGRIEPAMFSIFDDFEDDRQDATRAE